MAPRAGRLESGYDADLIALTDSPLEGNIEVFTHPDKITHVWKGGQMMKGPGLARIW